jgi:hypothetical protein
MMPLFKLRPDCVPTRIAWAGTLPGVLKKKSRNVLEPEMYSNKAAQWWQREKNKKKTGPAKYASY